MFRIQRSHWCILWPFCISWSKPVNVPVRLCTEKKKYFPRVWRTYAMKKSAIIKETYLSTIHSCSLQLWHIGMRVKKRIAISNVTNVSTINSWSLQLWLINEALNWLTSFYVTTGRSTCKHMYLNIKVDWRLSEMLKVQRAWNINTLASDAHLRKQK